MRRARSPRARWWVRFGMLLLSADAALPGGVGAATCWQPPVTGVIVDPFRAPACVWCAGNRGIEYRVGEASIVRAVATGTVTFSGTVAGTRYVVVQLPNGWRLTYGHLDAITVVAGDAVVVGNAIGSVSSEFFFGLRIGEEYADPARFIGAVVGRPRLVPVDGSSARPAPPAKVRCRVGEDAR